MGEQWSPKTAPASTALVEARVTASRAKLRSRVKPWVAPRARAAPRFPTTAAGSAAAPWSSSLTPKVTTWTAWVPSAPSASTKSSARSKDEPHHRRKDPDWSKASTVWTRSARSATVWARAARPLPAPATNRKAPGWMVSRKAASTRVTWTRLAPEWAGGAAVTARSASAARAEGGTAKAHAAQKTSRSSRSLTSASTPLRRARAPTGARAADPRAGAGSPPRAPPALRAPASRRRSTRWWRRPCS